MAKKLKQENIICINVNPGWIKTDMGGPKAQFTTEQAVTNILTNIVSKVFIGDSDKFFNFDGSEHLW